MCLENTLTLTTAVIIVTSLLSRKTIEDREKKDKMKKD
jgi:hypothetical protein